MNQNIHKYFAYGSNLSTQQMKERCESALFFCRASKRGYEICFPIISKRREGKGVASIRQNKNASVEGVVYTLSDSDLLKLDGFEGANYCRKRVFVESPKGKLLVWVYISKIDHGDFFAPSENYLNTIIYGAWEHRLNKNYIDCLSKLKINKIIVTK
jgi:gamma-glutamylcyclotransferase